MELNKWIKVIIDMEVEEQELEEAAEEEDIPRIVIAVALEPIAAEALPITTTISFLVNISSSQTSNRATPAASTLSPLTAEVAPVESAPEPASLYLPSWVPSSSNSSISKPEVAGEL